MSPNCSIASMLLLDVQNSVSSGVCNHEIRHGFTVLQIDMVRYLYLMFNLIVFILQARSKRFYRSKSMASSSEIGLAAGINILTAFAFLVAFAILRIQPLNDRVYFPKWYLKGLRNDPLQSGAFVQNL
ncbi:putative calcium permeable stress-gated cation channel 1 transmembrane domain-containing protein [Helianthus annuus]|uniref:Calcium permeable stress-gated cation channel 1 transmembrane domain-containing protein n=1 Tax=Helianthus annuus TaxID=4232 RepID=A0A9K3NTT3_HELAN|nr:putative calcium permeable stress-gated cation channel 1 transmembrane domain-containing protein [Helianthus annuus]